MSYHIILFYYKHLWNEMQVIWRWWNLCFHNPIWLRIFAKFIDLLGKAGLSCVYFSSTHIVVNKIEFKSRSIKNWYLIAYIRLIDKNVIYYNLFDTKWYPFLPVLAGELNENTKCRWTTVKEYWIAHSMAGKTAATR